MITCLNRAYRISAGREPEGDKDTFEQPVITLCHPRVLSRYLYVPILGFSLNRNLDFNGLVRDLGNAGSILSGADSANK